MSASAEFVSQNRGGGPQTAKGKVRSAKNATRHGVLSTAPVIAGESASAWKRHRDSVVESLGVIGALEETLAEQAASLLWRLGRLTRAELDAVTAGPIADVLDSFGPSWGRGMRDVESLTRYEAHLTRQLRATLAELREVQADRRARELEVH